MRYQTTRDAYLGVLRDVFEGGHECMPRGLVCYEIRNLAFTVATQSERPILVGTPEIQERIRRYTNEEIRMYFKEGFQAEPFEKAAKLWGRIKNPDGTINSNYGALIFRRESMRGNWESTKPITPWEWAVSSLLADRDTRQAQVLVALPTHRWVGNRDQVCTMHLNFAIRDDKLSMDVVMRSQDIVRGMIYDLPWWHALWRRMKVDLAENGLDVGYGEYFQLTHSAHVYRSDIERVRGILK